MSINIVLDIREKRLGGYIPIPRAVWYLLFEKHLSPLDFNLYLGMASLARFNKKNSFYGVVEFTTNELAIVFGVSARRIRARIKRLTDKGLIGRTEGKNNFYVRCYALLFSRGWPDFNHGTQKALLRTFMTLIKDKNRPDKDIYDLFSKKEVCCNQLKGSANSYSSKYSSYSKYDHSISPNDMNEDIDPNEVPI